MFGRLPERPVTLTPEELEGFRLKGVKVQPYVHTNGKMEQPVVELSQKAKKSEGSEIKQSFIIARELLTTIAERAQSLFQTFSVKPIQVQPYVRTKDDQSQHFVRLSQTKRRSDGSMMRQSFVVDAGSLSEIAKQSNEWFERKAETTEKRERKEKPGCWVVVESARALPGGTKVVATVSRTFDKQVDAELYAKDSPRVVWHEAIHFKPAIGDRLIVEAGKNTKIDLKIKQDEWQKATRGTFFSVGVWFDKGSNPYIGQEIEITPVTDFQGIPRDDRIGRPGRTLHPGDRKEPIYVLVERDPEKHDLGVVRFLSTDREKVIQAKMIPEERAQANRYANDNRLWQTVSFKPELRKKVNILTYISEHHEVDVIRQLDETGKERRTALVTTRSVDPDGKSRVTGKVWDYDELMSVARAQSRQQPVTPRTPAEPVTPRFTKPEQLSLALTRRVAEEPMAERFTVPEQLSSAPKPHAAEEPMAKRTPAQTGTLEIPKLAPGTANRDNKPFILCKWDQPRVPKADEWVVFPLNVADPEQRLITPFRNRTTDPVQHSQGEPARYVAVERLSETRGFGRIRGHTKNKDLAIQRTNALNEREETRQRAQAHYKEQARVREERRDEERKRLFNGPGF